MGLLLKTFRQWWQRPRRVADADQERSISFLELFYDLTYVVIIIQLTHTLAGHLDLMTFFQYVGLYMLVWFAWMQGSWYHDLHGNNDLRTRVFTFVQMFFLVWIGVFIHSATGTEQNGFALAYGGFLMTLTYLWWRTGVHDKERRVLSVRQSIMFLFASLSFLFSTRLTAEYAQFLWFGVVGTILVMPLFTFRLSYKANPEHMEQTFRIRPSLVERMGLLTIIVLGENLISIVGGAANLKEINIGIATMVSLTVLIVFSLWWLYFDFISGRAPKKTIGARFAWVYLHLFLTMSIGLTAVGLLNVIEYVTHLTPLDRWFVVGPAVLFLCVVVFISKTLPAVQEKKREDLYKNVRYTALGSAVLLFILGFTSVQIMVVLALTFVLLTFPVLMGLGLSIHQHYKQLLATTR